MQSFAWWLGRFLEQWSSYWTHAFSGAVCILYTYTLGHLENVYNSHWTEIEQSYLMALSTEQIVSDYVAVQ